MNTRYNLTPPSPPLSGGECAGGELTTSPSPDKGRAGEGFAFHITLARSHHA
jgi:hypothetical protein